MTCNVENDELGCVRSRERQVIQPTLSKIVRATVHNKTSNIQ